MEFIKNNRDRVFWTFCGIYMVVACIAYSTNVPSIIINGIAIGLFSILVLCDNLNKKFSKWLDAPIKRSKYKLTGEEAILWVSIANKAANGYYEFCAECEKDDKYYGWPWMSPCLTTDERALIDKIHEYFYPGDYIVDPIGGAQADYAWYNDIKNKVILIYA